MSVRALSIASAFAAVAAYAGTASAQQAEADSVLGGRVRGYHTPQNFALELRVSPYRPDVDSDPALHGATPYGTAFGDSRRLFVGLEFDWQALRIPHFGSLGPGAGIGYTSASAKAPFTGTSTPSAEDTSLDLLPMYLAAVLRVDVLWRDVGIPLVPYAKVGLGYALWRASNTLGTSSYNGVKGEGHSIGTHLALGIALNLNGFDAYAAQNLDDSLGINNTYLFAEWMREDLTGLGIQTDPLRVGGTNWTFGLAFEF